MLGVRPSCLGASLNLVRQLEVYWPKPVVETQKLSLKQGVLPVGASLTLFRQPRTIGREAICSERTVLTIEREGE